MQLVIDANGLASYVAVLQADHGRERRRQPSTPTTGMRCWRTKASPSSAMRRRRRSISRRARSPCPSMRTPRRARAGATPEETVRWPTPRRAPTTSRARPCASASPGDGGQIDIGALAGRGYIDVKFTVNVAGFTLDTASVTDLSARVRAERRGSGLDQAGRRPRRRVLLSQSGSDYTYRYWTTGEFAADSGATTDTVTLEFIAGSLSFTRERPIRRPTATTAHAQQRAVG